ncbi:MAG TPA: CHAT domain-containing tetratricopeptide repeat protein [Chthonomonadaceae bacterium]|nr:CHAT domain-containing tetratricopeptide repeat protein [Chthonomonadaceae bacterium]
MLIVEMLSAEGLAAQAGVCVGDHLLAYNNHALTSPALLQALSENATGTDLNFLQIHREGQMRTLSVPPGALGLEVRPELPSEVFSLYQQGQAAWQADNMEEAGRLWREAIRLLSVPHIIAWLEMRLGNRYEQKNALSEAISAYDRAWEVLQTTEENAQRYLCLAARGDYYTILQRDFSQAIACYQSALKLAEEEAYPFWNVRCLNGLGRVAGNCGDPASAKDYFSRALVILERRAPKALHMASLLNNLGIVTSNLGDLPAAEDYHQHALSIWERYAPISEELAHCLNNLGNVARKRGDLASAENYYLRSLAIHERLSPDSLMVAASFNNLGIVAYQRGDFASAEDHMHHCLAIRKRLAPDSLMVASSLNNLGDIACDRGDLAAAEDFIRDSLTIRERLAPDSLGVADNLKNLGNVARKRDNLASAEGYYLRSLAIQERLAPASLEAATLFYLLAQLARQQGNLTSAEGYYLRALAIQERLAPISLDVAESLYGLADLYRQQPQRALPYYHHALAIVENQRSQIASAETRSLLLAQHLDKYLGLLQTYLALEDTNQAFAVIERARARSLVEMLAERKINFGEQASVELLQQQQELDHRRTQAYTVLAKLSAEADDKIQSLHAQLRELERTQQQLTAQIRKTSPAFAALQYPQPLDLKGAQKVLDNGTLLLSYMIGEKQTYLFAITPRNLQVFPLSIEKKQLQQQVQQFREALDLSNLESNPEQALQIGRLLYQVLIAPAQPLLRRAKRLLVCPDGVLHILPFAALVVSSRGKMRYLGQEKPLHHTFSVTVYSQTRQQQKRANAVERGRFPSQSVSSATRQIRRVLALGDPLYTPISQNRRVQQPTRGKRKPSPPSPPSGFASEMATLRSRGLSLAPLPHTREEVQTIAQLFGEHAHLRTGEQATKTAVQKESAEADILHFACHGWLDSQVPLSSGLILTQPEALGKRAEQGDNGLLQVWEIFEQMHLKAELVVLSCCQSGLGQEVRGEGVIGLTRAFTYAGAQSVLVSLWEIHDASTSAFMEAFYRALKAGKSKDMALQIAICEMTDHPQWSHPFHWAAFLLHGDWR